MKMLDFTDTRAKGIYTDYVKRVKRTTRTLPKADRDDIIMEINSHIHEYINRNETAPELDNIIAITQKLGAPEEVLAPLVADKKMRQATKTFNPRHIAKALALNVSNGLSYIIFSLLYLFLFAFIFLIIAKLIVPSHVGLFMNDFGQKAFGWVGNPEIYNTEILGYWFIPVTLLLALIVYLIITGLLKLNYNLKHKH